MPDIRIDKKTKSYVLEDGSQVPIPEEYQRKILQSEYSREVSEKRKKELKTSQPETALSGLSVAARKAKSFAHEIPETLFEYGRAIPHTLRGPGPGQEEMGLLDRYVENFYAQRTPRKELEHEQEQAHPTAAMLGSIAGVGTDIIAAGNLPARYAFPAMYQLESEKSILEPVEAAKTMTGPALIGATLDAFFHGTGKIAQARGAVRGAKTANAAELKSTHAANVAEQTRFAAETKAAEKDLAARTAAEKQRFASETKASKEDLKLRTLEEKQRFSTDTQKAKAFEEEILERQREKLADQVKARNNLVIQTGESQKAMNEAFVESGQRVYEKLPQVLGKESVSVESMGVDDFIDNVLNLSPQAATKEGNRVTKFLKTLFKSDAEGKINSERIAKALKAIDQTITTSEGPVKDLLTQYKNFLFENLPQKLANSLGYEKFSPKIIKSLNSEVEKSVVNLMKNNHEVSNLIRLQHGTDFFTKFSQSINADIENIFANSSRNFQESISNGTLISEIENVIKNNPLYQDLMLEIEKRTKFFGGQKTAAPIVFPGLKEAEEKVLNLPRMLAQDAQSAIEKYAADIYIAGQEKANRANRLLNTLEREPGVLPQPPEIKAENLDLNQFRGLNQPVAPFTPPQPNQVAPYTAPNPKAVAPQNVVAPNLINARSLPETQGVLGKLGQALENLNLGDIYSQVKGNAGSASNIGILAHLAGIPVKKTAVGLAAAATGAKGLTSPGASGKAIRSALNQTARVTADVNAQAQNYASYSNGVLADPMDRRSLNLEIEQNPQLTLSDKAMMQTKVNRGIPLNF
jgi:hypothetical protein